MTTKTQRHPESVRLVAPRKSGKRQRHQSSINGGIEMNFCDKLLFFLLLIPGFLMLLQGVSKGQGKAGIQKTVFGKTSDQITVDLYTLTNANGIEVKIMTYGGTVVSIKAPDRNGKLADVV